MYIAGSNIMMRYVTDTNHLATVRDYSVGLTVLSISRIQGGEISKNGIKQTDFSPLSVVVEDTGKKKYFLTEGVYNIIMAQGMQKVHKDAIVSLRSSSFAKSVGCMINTQQFLEYDFQGNISSIMEIPPYTKVKIEIGSNLLDMFVQYEKFEMDV